MSLIYSSSSVSLLFSGLSFQSPTIGSSAAHAAAPAARQASGSNRTARLNIESPWPMPGAHWRPIRPRGTLQPDVTDSPLELADSPSFFAGSPAIGDGCRPSVSPTAFAIEQRSSKADIVLATGARKARSGTLLKDSEEGLDITELCRRHGISWQTFYRSNAKYGGLGVSDAQRLRQPLLIPQSNRRINPGRPSRRRPTRHSCHRKQ